MKLFKKAKKGFTLVELIVVIAIVAILAAVSVAGYYGFIASAKQSRADQEAAQVKLELQAQTVIAKDVKVSSVKYTFQFGNGGISAVKENGDKLETGTDVTLYFVELIKAAEDAETAPVSRATSETTPVAGEASIYAKVSATAGLISGFKYWSAEGVSSEINF